jgi:uncharacterized LabA/DUF88 family protein
MAKAAAHYLFIDAGCLRSTLEREMTHYLDKEHCRIDLTVVARNYTKTFLYDAVPSKDPNETQQKYEERIAPQQAMLERAGMVHGVHVYQGIAHRRQKKLEQKKVDVMITVDMLTHTFRRNMDYATLLTGDGDFHPLVDALVHDGMFANLWYPEGHSSRDLISAADARRPITIHDLYNFLSPIVQQGFRLPDTSSMAQEPERGTKLKEWSKDGMPYRLVEYSSIYFLYFRADPRGAVTQIHHPELHMLETYAKYELNIEIPE